MKQATRDRLNALNQRFYSAEADAFSAKRARPWPGFARALEHTRGALAAQAPDAAADAPPLRVLDVGCGNGRLIAALHARFGERFSYSGIDASEQLLAIARAHHPGAHVRFARADLVSAPAGAALPDAQFELVAVFGILHHVPGEAERGALIRAAAARLAPSGVLACTLWRLERSPRFARLRLEGEERERRLRELGLCEADLEPRDHLLRWGDGAAVRYCHLFDEAEVDRLLAAAGVAPIARFSSDGEGDALNDYLLLRASAP